MTSPLDEARASNSCSGLDSAELEELDAVARLYLSANDGFMRLVNRLGESVGSAVDRLPQDWRARIDGAAETALQIAWEGAAATQPRRDARLRGTAPLRWATGERWHRYATAATGALGGLGGLPTTLADLPVTITLILRSIQQIAAEYGEDPAADDVRRQCVAVFALGGPLPEDDEQDASLLAVRLALTGKAAVDIIRIVAPRLGIVVSEKLLAQATPLLGAAAGAAINPAFTRYYQRLAHVHFRLRAIEQRHAPEQVRACFDRIVRAKRGRASPGHPPAAPAD